MGDTEVEEQEVCSHRARAQPYSGDNLTQGWEQGTVCSGPAEQDQLPAGAGGRDHSRKWGGSQRRGGLPSETRPTGPPGTAPRGPCRLGRDWAVAKPGPRRAWPLS